MGEQETTIARMVEDTLTQHGYATGSRHDGDRRVVNVEDPETGEITRITIERRPRSNGEEKN